MSTALQPQIVMSPARKLIGISRSMTLAADTTRELWQQFGPRIREIGNRKNGEFVSMQIFDPSLMQNGLTPDVPFVKYAAVEVQDFGTVPHGLSTHTISGGLYAVFNHKGTPAMFAKTAAYIFGEWLPASGYSVDNREHFEIMPPGYKPDDPEATEEIWVPVSKVQL